MADITAPWTLDSLDSLKGSIDDLTLSLDSGLYQSSVTLADAAGDVSCSSALSAFGSRVQTAASAISSEATMDAVPHLIFFGVASIASFASGQASSIKLAGGAGDFVAGAALTANGGFIADGTAAVSGESVASVLPIRVRLSPADVNAAAAASATSIRVRFGGGDASAGGSVGCLPVRVRLSQANTAGAAEMYAFGGVVYIVAQDFVANVTIFATPTALLRGEAQAVVTAQLAADGFKQGQEWTPVSQGEETWALA